jgi:hypothetical protein
MKGHEVKVSPSILSGNGTVDLVTASGDVGHCLMVIRCWARSMAEVVKSGMCMCEGANTRW